MPMPSLCHGQNQRGLFSVKFGYSEKATKFEKIFHLKFDVTEMFSNFVAFSEYPNFNKVNGNGNVRGFSHVFMKIVFLEF